MESNNQNTEDEVLQMAGLYDTIIGAAHLYRLSGRAPDLLEARAKVKAAEFEAPFLVDVSVEGDKVAIQGVEVADCAPAPEEVIEAAQPAVRQAGTEDGLSLLAGVALSSEPEQEETEAAPVPVLEVRVEVGEVKAEDAALNSTPAGEPADPTTVGNNNAGRRCSLRIADIKKVAAASAAAASFSRRRQEPRTLCCSTCADSFLEHLLIKHWKKCENRNKLASNSDQLLQMYHTCVLSPPKTEKETLVIGPLVRPSHPSTLEAVGQALTMVMAAEGELNLNA